jgi:hypothetical protein
MKFMRVQLTSRMQMSPMVTFKGKKETTAKKEETETPASNESLRPKEPNLVYAGDILANSKEITVKNDDGKEVKKFVTIDPSKRGPTYQEMMSRIGTAHSWIG